jgi:microcystin-dependent protein
MGQPYVGEIRLFAGNFAPVGWMTCDGQLLPITGNETLFNLIGTTYGGDGNTTFALPDLRSRVPIHMGSRAGNTYPLASAGGSETVTLTIGQLPAHSHIPQAVSGGARNNPAGNTWANWPGAQFSTDQSGLSAMNTAALGTVGGSQPHDNRSPYLALNFIISTFGIFPSQV